MSCERDCWILLNCVQGMTTIIFYRLVEHFKSAENVLNASEKDLEGSNKIPPAVLRTLLELRKKYSGESEIEKGAALKAKIFTLLDEDYPLLLKKTPAPPPVIYVKGAFPPDDEWRIAIVGTRNCTGYGADVAFTMASDLARMGYTVVSGLAKGIDVAAHKGALRAGGRTVAVFGTGIETVYPPAHSRLAADIEESGALVSEFAIGSKTLPQNFPRRNWVISGLSKGTIVVEAGQKSGAMITARLAEEQGRDVFAVPGDINARTTKGPHWLIKHGAYLVESAEDITDILGTPQGQSELSFEEPPENDEHSKVLDILSERPAKFDEICALLEMPAGEVSSTLMMLEMKGRVRMLPGRMYIKC